MSITYYAARFNPARGCHEYLEQLEGLNLNNRNGRHLAEALHLSFDEGFVEPTPIELVIARCTAYLRNHLGRPDPALEGRVEQLPGGCTIIEGDRDAGYLQLRVRQLQTLAREGQALGATHVYAG